MTREQFEREMNYRAAMNIAKEMLRRGFIDAKDYAKIDAAFKRKYKPVIGAILG